MRLFKFILFIFIFGFGLQSSYAQNIKIIDSLPGGYIYDIGGDTYTSTLGLNKDSTFEFYTFGCFTDESTYGKWNVKGNTVYLNSDSVLKNYIVVEGLGQKYNANQLDYIFEIVDSNNNPLPNVECTLVSFDSSLSTSYSDDKGICVLKATEPIGFEVKVANFQKTTFVWAYTDDGSTSNYEKLKITKATESFFFTEAEFELHEKGLQGNNSFTKLFYTKRH